MYGIDKGASHILGFPPRTYAGDKDGCDPGCVTLSGAEVVGLKSVSHPM